MALKLQLLTEKIEFVFTYSLDIFAVLSHPFHGRHDVPAARAAF
jgi:hypothetical protein